jgi:hypothetical protein
MFEKRLAAAPRNLNVLFITLIKERIVMDKISQKNVSVAAFDIFIIKFCLAEMDRLADQVWLKDLFEKMIVATGLKIESPYFEGQLANAPRFFEDKESQSYQATQFFNGGFLNLFTEPEENLLFLFFSSSLALLDHYNLEKIAKLAVPSAGITTRKSSSFF